MERIARAGFGLGLLLLGACGGAAVTEAEAEAGAGAGGEAGQGPTKELAAALPEGAFNVTARVERGELGDDYDYYASRGCLAFDFTSRFVARKDDWSFEAAVDGELASTVLARGAKTHAARLPADEVELGGSVLSVPAGACCERLDFSEIEMAREGDGFRGAGKARLIKGDCGGDIDYFFPVDVELVGTRDETAPTLALPSAPIHPLEPTLVMASEVLDSGASAEIERERGFEPVPGSSRRPSQVSGLWSFEVPPLLRFDLSAAWRARGTDWAGNALISEGALRTWADPGFFAQDGFEGEVLAAGTAPRFGAEALAGQRSLLIDAEDAVTFQLETRGGSAVVFDALSPGYRYDPMDTDNETHSVRYHVGVVGGTQVTSGELPLAFVDSASDEPEPRVVRVPLPEAGDAVIVSFDIESFDDNGDCGLIDCVSVPALIDDLRVE